jgi:hypothetical protein
MVKLIRRSAVNIEAANARLPFPALVVSSLWPSSSNIFHDRLTCCQSSNSIPTRTELHDVTDDALFPPLARHKDGLYIYIHLYLSFSFQIQNRSLSRIHWLPQSIRHVMLTCNTNFAAMVLGNKHCRSDCSPSPRCFNYTMTIILQHQGAAAAAQPPLRNTSTSTVGRLLFHCVVVFVPSPVHVQSNAYVTLHGIAIRYTIMHSLRLAACRSPVGRQAPPL